MRTLLLRLMTSARPLGLAAEALAGLITPRQPTGALGVIVGRDGRILIAQHLTRPDEPWGLPGGWLRRGEPPEDGLTREIGEELGIAVTVQRYVRSHLHWHGPLRPRGITLVFRLSAPLANTSAIPPKSWEILQTRWVTPEEAALLVTPETTTSIRMALASPLAESA